jgi:hypothetical protein
MFDAEQRVLASCFVESALAGKRGAKLIETVRTKFPDATRQALRRASFIAVTRPSVDEQAVLPIYDVGISLSRWTTTE